MLVSVALATLLAGNAAAAASGNLRRQLQTFESIAGYNPGSQVTDHNALDLDQGVIEAAFDLTPPDFATAKNVYERGGYSKSFARVTLSAATTAAIPKGTVITGLDASGGTVNGKALSDFDAGSLQIEVQYSTGNEQASYVNCQVGRLPADLVNTDGCFAATGVMTVTGLGQVQYSYDPLTDNDNARTIRSFSTSAETRMLNCPIGCPYVDFAKFNAYYGFPDYGDRWVTAALDGTNANLGNVTADFSTGLGADPALRLEAAQKGAAYMNVWMYVIREFEDALDDCKDNCINCNDDPVHAWDEGVAFYTGSSHGTMLGSTDSGFMIYALANKRCKDFKTCGTDGTEVTGNSKVNFDLMNLFNQGRTQLQSSQCEAARITKNQVVHLMTIPALQGTLRYAYIVGEQGTKTPKAIGEGFTFAASVLPMVDACSSADAQIIADNMKIDGTHDFMAVKEAFERNYECLQITCEDVGGYYDSGLSEYFPKAAPCGDEPLSNIAGYMPGSQVTDHNAIDLDQAAIETYLNGGAGSFADAKSVYTNGAYSKSFARVTLATGLTIDLAKGALITGVSESGGHVEGKALDGTAMGSTSLKIQYITNNNQENYVNCQVGGLLAADANTEGCFATSGTIIIAGIGPVSYSYNPLTDNDNARTIRGFSTSADSKMLSCDGGCPYPDFLKFYNYYGSADYGNRYVTAAFDGTNAGLANGNADFSSGVGTDPAARDQAIKKGTAYMIVWMYVIREFEDALDDCKDNCINCNDDPVHAWDEGVAFYTGSLHGTEPDPSTKGKLIYSLANKRCADFKTCGANGDAITGISKVNIELFKLFEQGKTQLQNSQCAAARVTKEQVTKLMGIPGTQGVIRYAHILGPENNRSNKNIGEGAVFAASVLPILHACSPRDAQIVSDNMSMTATSTSFEAVKSAFERNYACMGFTCADVGGYYDDAMQQYFPGAEPCSDIPFSNIAGYVPGSQVTDHNAIDLDQQALERYLDDEDFQAAGRVYTEGAHSKSFARVTLAGGLTTSVAKGTIINGLSATGEAVNGKALAEFASGSTTIDIQYVTGNNQATYVNCQVGGLAAVDANTAGCFAASGTISIAGIGPVSYSYNPLTDNNNARTIKGFSTSAESKMLNCDNGCPYPDFLKFYNYYGSADYADKWITASIAGTNANLANGNADFSSGFPNSPALRVETFQKGTSYMSIWMYVLREFEDAIGDCQKGCINCNDDPVHAWDEGVAFYTGSSHGENLDSVEPGYLIYSLANKRCADFKTCGADGNSISGNSQVNIRLFKFFEEGKNSLRNGRCGAANNRKKSIANLMAVPLVQGVLRYAHITGQEGNFSPKSVGEGAVFTASILPVVHACSPSDAVIIYDNMNVASADGTDFAAVKAAFERNYECMGVKCSDIGGYYNAETQSYFPGAEPCEDPDIVVISFPPGVCFDGESTVQLEGVEEPVLLRDVRVGDSVLVGEGKYDQVYSFGHYGPDEEATFLSISTDATSQPIKISEEHLLFVNASSGRKSIPASNVVEGDELVLADGSLATVTGIEATVETGVFAPFTKSGTIVVSGVLASSYVTMQPGSETLVVAGVDTTLTYQWLGHILQTPHRMVCQFFFSQCEAETYGENGVSGFVQPALDLSVFFLNQNSVIAWMMFAFGLLPLLALFVAAEFVVTSPVTCACTAGALVVAYKTRVAKTV